MTDELCPKCQKPTLYGRHLRDEKCEPKPLGRPAERCTDAEYSALIDALASRGLRPSDLVRELRREGKRISTLSELTSFEARRLTDEARKAS